MPSNVRQLLENGTPIYPITERSLVIGLQDAPFEYYVLAWDGASTPVVSKIPAGVVVTYNNTNYTGTLAASATTAPYLYLVASTTQAGEYDRYIVTNNGNNTFSWTPVGSTAPVTPVIVDNLTTNDATKALSAKQGKVLKDELSQFEAKVNGDAKTKSYSTTAGTAINTTSDPVNFPLSSGKKVYILIDTEGVSICRVNQLYFKINGSWSTQTVKPIIGEITEYTLTSDVTDFGFVLNAVYVDATTTMSMKVFTENGLKNYINEEVGKLNTKMVEKANELNESVNLFDMESAISGKYITGDGQVLTGNNYFITPPYEILPGESIISNKIGTGVNYALFKNTNENSGITVFTKNSSPYVLTNTTVKTLYARFSFKNDDTGIMINRGATSLEYRPYTGTNKVIRETDVVNEYGSSTKVPVSQKFFTDKMEEAITEDSIVQVLGNNEDKVVSQAKVTELLGLDFGGNIVKSDKFDTVSGTNLNTTGTPTLFNVKKGDVLYIELLGSASNASAKALTFYYRANGSFVNTRSTLLQGYVYAYVMPEDADAFGFYSLGSQHSDGYLQLVLWTKVSIPEDVKHQTIKDWTLERVVRQWMNGDKCPIGFIGDSTTDGTATTGWNVQNSHPRQDARNWLEYHPEFMPDATTEEREVAAQNAGYGRGTVDYICTKAFPYLLEKLIQAELGNNNARVYNIGYYGMALTSYLDVDVFFSDVYSDCKMAGIMLGVNDRGSVDNYGTFYNNVLQLLERYVLMFSRVNVVPFMVTNQYVTQSGNNPNSGGGIPDIMFNDDVQTIINRAKVEVAKKYGLEIIDLNGFGRLVFMCSSYAYSNLTEDLHFKDLGHKLEAGFLFSQLIPWVNKTGNAGKVYIGFGGAYNKSDFNVGKYETDTNDRFKREINYTRDVNTDICIFDSYVFNNSNNGAYTVKYLTPVASGYIVVDGDTENPIQITATEMNLGTWDIGLHHIQVYTGASTTVAFKGFLLESVN